MAVLHFIVDIAIQRTTGMPTHHDIVRGNAYSSRAGTVVDGVFGYAVKCATGGFERQVCVASPWFVVGVFHFYRQKAVVSGRVVGFLYHTKRCHKATLSEKHSSDAFCSSVVFGHTDGHLSQMAEGGVTDLYPIAGAAALAVVLHGGGPRGIYGITATEPHLLLSGIASETHGLGIETDIVFGV